MQGTDLTVLAANWLEPVTEVILYETPGYLFSTDCRRGSKQTSSPSLMWFVLHSTDCGPKILNWNGQGTICNHCKTNLQYNGLPRSMSICLLVPVDCLKAIPDFTERINRCHTPQMVWSPVTALHISLFYWMWLTPPDIYIFLQPCTVVANKTTTKKKSREGERGGRKAGQAARQVMVWNTEEGCVELWLGTPSRSIFPCLKPQRPGNGRAAGAFRGCGTGDEGSRSGEAKLRGDFPSRGLFILEVEEVSALPLLLEPGGASKLLPTGTLTINWIQRDIERYPPYRLSALFIYISAHVEH